MLTGLIVLGCLLLIPAFVDNQSIKQVQRTLHRAFTVPETVDTTPPEELTQDPDIHLPAHASQQGFATVGGQTHATILALVEFIANKAKYNRYGIRLPAGILLEGPSGTGKTLTARAVAAELNVPFFGTSITELLDRWIGSSEYNIREKFEQAYDAALSSPKKVAILFFDEIDALGNRNSDLLPFQKQIINEFLVQMDGFNKRTDATIIVMGATNYATSLDPALLRAGRFDRIVTFTLPDQEARTNILMMYLNRIAYHTKDIDVEALARYTAGKSGAYIENLVNQAAIQAIVVEKDCCVRQHHFMTVLNEMTSR